MNWNFFFFFLSHTFLLNFFEKVKNFSKFYFIFKIFLIMQQEQNLLKNAKYLQDSASTFLSTSPSTSVQHAIGQAFQAILNLQTEVMLLKKAQENATKSKTKVSQGKFIYFILFNKYISSKRIFKSNEEFQKYSTINYERLL